MLFCTRKPPKTEDRLDESTHYQGLIRRMSLEGFFSTVVDENKKYCLARSIDDKAYIRPGTSEGFEKKSEINEFWCQLQKIKCEGSQSRTGHKKVYMTPSTHRRLSKEAVIVDGVECSVNSDIHIIFARPKSYAECNGTTWANEPECLRCMMPDKFEVPTCKKDTSVIYSQEFRCICAHFCDKIRLFTIMTTDEDLSSAIQKEGELSKFTLYDIERILHLKQMINSGCNSDKVHCFSEGEKEIYASRLIPPIKDIISAIDKVLLQLCGGDKKQILNSYDKLLLKCGKLKETVNEFQLPAVKPRLFDNSNAGTGVGVTNFEIRFDSGMQS